MTIGFHKEPEHIDETWTREYRGQTFTFSKSRKGPHHFVYNCTRHVEDKSGTLDTTTGLALDRELARAEIESWKQFVDFMEGLT